LETGEVGLCLDWQAKLVWVTVCRAGNTMKVCRMKETLGYF